MSEIVPDHIHRGAFVVRRGPTEQSWVDLADPLRLEFEYVQRIAELLELTVLARPDDQRVRFVHIGGGGLSLPRYVEARRPGSWQVVFEPDIDLVEQVRTRLPLPRRSGIRIRTTDGRSGLAAMQPDTADVVIVDAFAGSQVPGELATTEFFSEAERVLRKRGILLMNLGDRAPFDWGRRCVAAMGGPFAHLAAAADGAVWKGRRYGNLVVAASRHPLPVADWERDLARGIFGYKLHSGPRLLSWVGGLAPFTDADTRPSQDPIARGWLP